MAAPLKMTRATVVRLIRRLNDDIRPAAAAAGHALPSPEFGDGITRATARELRLAALHIAEFRQALVNPDSREEAQAFLRLCSYFEAEHPQTAAGDPAAWPAAEPLSPSLAAFARRDSDSIDPAALLPHEIDSLVHYAQVRNDPADFEGARADTVRGESEQLVAAAEKIAEIAPLLADELSGAAGAESPMTGNPAREAALEQRSALLHDPAFLERYRSPHLSIRRKAIDEMIAVNQAIAGAEEQHQAPPAATATIAVPPPANAAATARKAPPVEPAALRASLQGLSGSPRAAKLAELFPLADAAPTADAPAPSPPAVEAA